MTPPDSVGKVVAEMQEHVEDLENAAVQIEASDLADKFAATAVEFRKAAAEVADRATRLQALDRQRQEECEALRVKANTLGDGYLDASHRAQTAEAALAEAHRWLTELSDYIVNERDRQVLPRKAASYQRELDELTTFLTRIAKEPKE